MAKGRKSGLTSEVILMKLVEIATFVYIFTEIETMGGFCLEFAFLLEFLSFATSFSVKTLANRDFSN